MNTLLQAPADQAAGASAESRTSSFHRILLVDDDITMRRLNSQVLARSGYQVDTAEDGEDGWEALHANSYDLLITDNNMPRLSGVELVKKMYFAHLTLPIIMASGTFITEELNRHPWLQLAATLRKPFTTDKLLATVKEVLPMPGAIHDSTVNFLPVLSETIRRTESWPHWGINE